MEEWRRGGDSNPRCPEGHTGFRNQRVQPLCHLSAPEAPPACGGPGCTVPHSEASQRVSLLSSSAPRAEELLQERSRLLGQDALLEFQAVIRLRMIEDPSQRNAGTELGVADGEHGPTHACVDQSTRAHEAGLYGRVHDAVHETHDTQDAGGGTQHEELGMGGGIGVGAYPVVGPRQDFLAAHDHGSDRDLFLVPCCAGLREGELHEALVQFALLRSFGPRGFEIGDQRSTSGFQSPGTSARPGPRAERERVWYTQVDSNHQPSDP